MPTLRASLVTLCLLSAPAGGAESWRDKGTTLYYRGELTAAAHAFEKAVGRSPQSAAAHLDAAVVYRDLDEHDRSRRLFHLAAKLSDGDPDIHAAHGWAALRSGKLEEARAAFNAALARRTGHPQALAGLAHLQLRQGKYLTALSTAERLTALRPDITLGHVLAGRAHDGLGDKRKAAEAYVDALESDNTYSEVRLWLGPLYKSLHHYNDAWRQYAKVLFVSPRHDGAAIEKKHLAALITRQPQEIIPSVKLKHHLPIWTAKEHRKMPVIRVAIGTTAQGNPAAKKTVAFTCDGPFEVFDPETGKTLAVGPARQVWTARRVRRGRGYAFELLDHNKRVRTNFRKVIAVRPQDLRRHSLMFQRLEIASGTVWEFQGDRQLKGIIEIRARGQQGLYLINELPLEDYTYGVINQEMPSRYPLEALKAQAVIARNHALQSQSYRLHSRDRYDLCDGQHCQVFSGVSGETKKGRQAVDATRGEVLKYRGRLAHTPYSSNCGGHTQDSGEVQGWSRFPYLSGRKDTAGGPVEQKSPWELDRWFKSRPDVFCNIPEYMHSSQFRWSRIISANELGDRIRRVSGKFGLLRKIRILKRSLSGNVNKIEFRGTRGRLVVDREQRIRGIMGVSSIRNTSFSLEVDRNADGVPTDIFAYGAGWGHSIGLCQIGAAGRAARGQSYKEIVTHYYKGTEVQNLGY
ncbi:MAG: SpoIID/LytB domain-containing protein [Elusimicrobiota bacterium]